jgi:hypothetical protein
MAVGMATADPVAVSSPGVALARGVGALNLRAIPALGKPLAEIKTMAWLGLRSRFWSVGEPVGRPTTR